MDTGLKYLQTQLAMMKCKKKGLRFIVIYAYTIYTYRYQKIMLKCWERDPNERPTFAQVVIEIETLLSNSVGYLDLTL